MRFVILSDDFPHTSGAYQTVNNAEDAQSGNAFVAKLNPPGSKLLYSTYLGGSGIVNVAPLYDDAPVGWGDSGSAIAVDSIGDAYITGYAVSGNFPVTNGAYMTQDPSEDGNEDGDNPVAFFSTLNPAGSQLLYSTFMGGLGCGTGIGAGYDGTGDLGIAIAVDPTGNVYLAGNTCSENFPTSGNAFDPTNKASCWSGFTTGFVSKFEFPDAATLSLASSANPANQGETVTCTAHLTPQLVPCRGTVYIEAGNGIYDTVAPLDASYNATFSLNVLTPGEHNVAAHYSGDSNCSTSKVSLNETIIGKTTTSVTSSDQISTPGRPVTFTAVVTGGGVPPVNYVSLMNGNTYLGEAALTPNGAISSYSTFTTTSLPLGTLSITAIYGGSGSYSGSTSPVLTEAIEPN